MRSGDAGLLEALGAICGASNPTLAVCALKTFCALLAFLCIAVNLIVSAMIVWHAAAAAMADLEASSALLAAWATKLAAALISLFAFDLIFCYLSRLGKYFFVSKLSSLFTISSDTSANLSILSHDSLGV